MQTELSSRTLHGASYGWVFRLVKTIPIGQHVSTSDAVPESMPNVMNERTRGTPHLHQAPEVTVPEVRLSRTVALLFFRASGEWVGRCAGSSGPLWPDTRPLRRREFPSPPVNRSFGNVLAPLSFLRDIPRVAAYGTIRTAQELSEPAEPGIQPAIAFGTPCDGLSTFPAAQGALALATGPLPQAGHGSCMCRKYGQFEHT